MDARQIRKNKTSAFSLIELLVVITIIGVLAAVAIPTYSNYQIRATIASVIPALDGMAKSIEQQFAIKGTIPAGLLINGVLGSFQYFNQPPIQWVEYTNTFYTSPLPGYSICVYLAGLQNMQIPDSGGAYIAPNSSGRGQRGRICMTGLYNQASGVMNRYCGVYGVSAFDLPKQYLPIGCNCNNLYNLTCYGG